MNKPLDFPIILDESKLKKLADKIAKMLVVAELGVDKVLIPHPENSDSMMYSDEAEKVLKIERAEMTEFLGEFFKVGNYSDNF